MNHNLSCWRCGATLAALSLPLSRLDQCPDCGIDLHVCRMCNHYDRHVAEQCRHDDAEFVKEKERPNFCDYFAPSEAAFTPDGGEADAARRQLDALFGGDADAADRSGGDAADDLDALFRKT